MTYKYPWVPIKEYKEILFHKYEGIARISINRQRFTMHLLLLL